MQSGIVGLAGQAYKLEDFVIQARWSETEADLQDSSKPFLSRRTSF